MSWAAVGVAGASVVSGMMGSSSAKKAARAQAAAIREATALQRQMYNTTRKDLSQYRDIGSTAGTEITNNMPELTRSFTASDFVKDPGYDFRMQEGQKALERSAAARGGLMGGAAGKAMARYGQDYASNEYQNVYNRFNADRDQRFNKLSGLLTIGQNAAAQTGAAAQNFGNQAGSNIIGGGNAQAASAIAGGNAWSNAIGQGIGAYTAMNGGNNNGDVSKLGTIAGNYSQPTNLSEMIKATA
jgi:hypothetical protein